MKYFALMILNLIQAFQTASSKLMGTSLLYLEKIEIQKGGGEIAYMREGVVAKSLSHCESLSIESICIELTIFKRKWCILFVYRPPTPHPPPTPQISIKESSSKKFQTHSVKLGNVMTT